MKINEKEQMSIFTTYLSNCVNTHPKTYYNKEFILSLSSHKNQIGFIKEGRALIMKTDQSGNSIILKELKKYDIFSHLFFQETEDEIYIISTTTTEVIFIDYFSIIKNCSRGCPFHQNLILILVELLMISNKQQNEKIELLSKRNVREKIEFFLKQRMNDQRIFKVTTSYTAIAEYIAVDRSHFMRELKKMEQEKQIERKGKIIKIKR